MASSMIHVERGVPFPGMGSEWPVEYGHIHIQPDTMERVSMGITWYHWIISWGPPCIVMEYHAEASILSQPQCVEILLGNCYVVNATEPHKSEVNLGLINGLVPSDKKAVTITNVDPYLCHHMMSLCHNEFIFPNYGDFDQSILHSKSYFLVMCWNF